MHSGVHQSKADCGTNFLSSASNLACSSNVSETSPLAFFRTWHRYIVAMLSCANARATAAFSAALEVKSVAKTILLKAIFPFGGVFTFGPTVKTGQLACRKI